MEWYDPTIFSTITLRVFYCGSSYWHTQSAPECSSSVHSATNPTRSLYEVVPFSIPTINCVTRAPYCCSVGNIIVHMSCEPLALCAVGLCVCLVCGYWVCEVLHSVHVCMLCINTCKLTVVSISCPSELLLSFSATRDTSTPLLMINTSRPLTMSFVIIIIISNNYADRKIYFCMLCVLFIQFEHTYQLYIRMLLWCVRMVYAIPIFYAAVLVFMQLCVHHACACTMQQQLQLGNVRICTIIAY